MMLTRILFLVLESLVALLVCGFLGLLLLIDAVIEHFEGW